ncbi:MAG TPA: protein kinase [Polyangiaceae bacterium]|nr:protein kinase [Polyangiaceae bacterium]
MHPGTGPDIGIREGDLLAGKYRVDRILGVGGMGVVVAAHHLRLDDLVAIKLLLPEALADADSVRRFEREARAAVKIKSEHVARIIDVGTLDSGAPFIVMEYLAGEDLADRIVRTGPLSVEDAIELIVQSCEAIAEAHALGIVHRDLKPANLFCVQGADGRTSVKVLDFGISKLTHTGTASSGLGMTKTRAVMGSPYYMSPEQMESPRAVDARTDIWSLGVVLYQVLTGDVPFNGETLPQVCVNVATRPAPSLRKSRPDVPSGLEAIVLRCLEKEPSKRFPTIAALATALARFGPRRTQASLDRITRTWRQAEARQQDPAGRRHPSSSDRTVTGPLPSWGGTAKSLEGRTRSIIGWGAGVMVVGMAAITFTFLESSKRPAPTQAVLITPPGASEQRDIAKALPSSGPFISPTPSGVSRVEGSVAASSASVASSLPRAFARDESPTAAPAPAKLPSSGPPDLPRAATSPSPAVANRESSPYGVAPETPPSPAAAATCVLNLNALPVARVVLDGKALGFTPTMGIRVVAGEHEVVFRWDDGTRRTSVTCAKGETKTVAERRSDPTPSDDLPEKNPYR